ncbi:unnamed protein product [Tilletia controversa]|nr:unnamed protein product [Tilletia controversa]
MERKRAVAEGRTPPPEGDSDLDDWSPAKDRPAVATQLEVLEEMRRDADWIRNELREGRDRRAYGDQEGDEEGEEMDEDEDAETVGSTNGSPVKKMTKAKAKAKPAKTTALRVDEQSAGAQEDLVAVVTDAPSSAGGAGPSETASDSSASGAVGLRIDDDGKVALVVKPAVAADPSAEVTPTEAVAVAGGQGRSTGKRRR